MFRRTTVSAEDAIERSKEIYGPLGGKFNEAKLRWRMPFLFAFDLLEINGQDLRREPLEVRKRERPCRACRD
jgi:hypothetical protein